MANYDESDEDIFITQSSYGNCSPIGSDTDEVLNDVLELEASKYVKGSSSSSSEISSEDDELLSSTLKAEREFSGNRQEAEESRFGSPLAAKDLEKIVKNAKCKNTENKARWAVGVFCKWQEARSKCEQILSKKSLIAMTNKELSESLSYFIVEVRNEAGGEYRPNTIYELIISIQYYMRKNGKSVNILEDEVFAKMRSVLDAKMKQLSRQGLGIEKNQADVITTEQEEILWSKGILGCSNPRTLLNTMVYLIGLHFALRAEQEHRNLRFGEESQISLKQDASGRRYLQYTEDVSKTNPGGLQHRKVSAKCTRVYECQNKERCIVDLYLKYINAR